MTGERGSPQVAPPKTARGRSDAEPVTGSSSMPIPGQNAGDKIGFVDVGRGDDNAPRLSLAKRRRSGVQPQHWSRGTDEHGELNEKVHPVLAHTRRSPSQAHWPSRPGRRPRPVPLEIHPDGIARLTRGQPAAAGVGSGAEDALGQALGFRGLVLCCERGVRHGVDPGHRCEPPQPKPAPLGQAKAVSDRFISAATCCIQSGGEAPRAGKQRPGCHRTARG